MGQWLIPCLLSSCPVGQMAGSWGWLHEDIRVVAQGVMLGITQRCTCGAWGWHWDWGFAMSFGAEGKVVPEVWGKADPAAGSVLW